MQDVGAVSDTTREVGTPRKGGHPMWISATNATLVSVVPVWAQCPCSWNIEAKEQDKLMFEIQIFA